MHPSLKIISCWYTHAFCHRVFRSPPPPPPTLLLFPFMCGFSAGQACVWRGATVNECVCICVSSDATAVARATRHGCWFYLAVFSYFYFSLSLFYLFSECGWIGARHVPLCLFGIIHKYSIFRTHHIIGFTVACIYSPRPHTSNKYRLICTFAPIHAHQLGSISFCSINDD